MQTYDLIAIDIDGTLLDSRNNVSSSLLPLFREVEARGSGVTLISGRPDLTVAPLMRELGLTMPYVSSGGAQIVDPVTGETISSFTLSQPDVQALANLGREVGAGLVAMEARRLYYEGDIEKFALIYEANEIDLSGLERIKTSITQVEDIVQAAPQPLKFTISDMPEVLAHVEKRIRSSNLLVYGTYSLPVYLEFTSIYASKGTALKRLAEYLEIPLERVLVIGDSPNDLSMFSVAGTAVAMGNATEEVKRAAHLIAPSNDEDGVAWVLRELVLKNKSIS